MTMDPSEERKEPDPPQRRDAAANNDGSNAKDDQVTSYDATDGATTDESTRRKRKALSDEKIEERKAANRKSAAESRERRKALIRDLQQAVERLTNENKDLRAMNGAMRFQLQSVLVENQQLRLVNAQGIQSAALPNAQGIPSAALANAQAIQPIGPTNVPQQQPNVGNIAMSNTSTQPVAAGNATAGVPPGLISAGGLPGNIPITSSNTIPNQAQTVNSVAAVQPNATDTSQTSPTVNPAAALNINPFLLGATGASPSSLPTQGQPITMPLLSFGNAFPLGLMQGMVNGTFPGATPTAIAPPQPSLDGGVTVTNGEADAPKTQEQIPGNE